MAGEIGALRISLGASTAQFEQGMRRAAGSLNQFGAVQRRAAAAAGQYRAGMQQLGFQINDVATQLASGTRISTIFAQQSGQVIQAIQLMSGGASRFAQFMGGPWGVAMTAGAVVLLPLIARLFDTRTELEKATEKVAENARQTELNRLAQEAYARTLPGVIDQIRQQTEALRQQNQTVEQSEQLAIRQAQTNAARVEGWRDLANSTIPALERAIEAQERANRALSARGPLGTRDLAAGMQRLAELRRMLQAARAAAEALNRQLDAARANIRAADAARIGREVNEGNDPLAREAGNLRRAEAALLEQYRAGEITRDRYRQQLDELRDASRRRTEQLNREAAAERRVNTERNLVRPTTGNVLSPFGADRSEVPISGRRIAGRRHQGVDLVGRIGDPVVAPEGGTAFVRNAPGGLGLYVEIRADSGARNLLAHLSAARVQSGQRVEAGQLVGLVGQSGNARGPHLHWQRQVNGRWTNPMAAVGASGAAQAAQRASQEAAREAEERARNEAAFQDELARLGDDLLEARRRSVRDVELLADYAVAENELARERRNAGYAEMERRGRLDEAQRRQLVEANDAAAAERKRAIHANLQLQLDEQRYRIAVEDLRDAQQIEQARGQLVRTVAERRDSELRLLAMQRDEELLALRKARADAQLIENVERRAAELARLDAAERSINTRYGLAADLARQRNLSPVQEFLSRAPQSAREMNEALEAVAAGGLESLTNGLTDAITGVKSLGDAFSEMARSVIADIIRMTIRMLIFRVISGMFGGGAPLGGIGGNIGASVLGGIGAGAFGGFRAAGGPVLPGRTYVVGEKGPELLHMGESGRIIPNEGIGGAGGRVVIELRDEMLQARIAEGSQIEIARSYPAIKHGIQSSIAQQNRRRG